MFMKSLAVALAFGAAYAAPALADLSSTVEFNIASQPLSAALLKYSEQSRVQVTSPAELMEGRSSGEVVGKRGAREALRELLRGTDLSYDVIDGNTVVIRGSAGSSAQVDGDSRQGVVVAQVEGEKAGQGSEGEAEGGGSLSEGSKLQEIVVTAQKREERLIDVPISISALDGAALDSSTREGALDALKSVPGVYINDSGNLFLQTVTIRGVVTGALESGSSTAAYYIDAVPFGFVRNGFVPDAGSFDLDRIEVLRGPQGTLYGASALNGVVRVLTKNADTEAFDFKARAASQTTEDGDPGYRGDAAINLPVIEGKLGVRATAGYQDLGGWIDQPNKRNANDNRMATARLKARATPTDDLTIDLSGWWSQQDIGGQNSSTDEKTRSSVLPETASNDFDTYSAEIVYALSAVQLTSRTSYIDFATESFLDFAPFYIALGIPEDSPDFEFRHYNSQFKARAFAQEVILNSTADGVWKWTAGAIYRRGKDNFIQGLTTLPRDLNYINRSKSYAVFGEVTRELIEDRLELTGGLRYFHDEVSVDDAIPPTPAEALSRSRNFEKVTPRAVLTWHPNPDATVYASYAQGFRSGLLQDPFVLRNAGNAVPVTKPDSLTNYEIGTKHRLLSGRLYVDAAVFYTDWEDVFTAIGIPLNDNIFTSVLNGGGADGVGAEIGLTFQPLDGLLLSGGVSWNDLTYNRDVPTTTIRKGNRLANSPEYTASASIDYSFPLASVKGHVGASANYRSTMGFIGGGVLPEVLYDYAEAGERFIARAEAGIEADRGWGAKVYVDNVTDSYTGGENFYRTFTDWTTRPRPRTFGVQFEYKFQ